MLGHRPRGLLQILREDWDHDMAAAQDPTVYWQEFQRWVQLARNLAKNNLQEAQRQQKERYDAHSKVREFDPGQKLLLLLPMSTNKLLTQWHGPFEIIQRVGTVDYEVHRPGHLRTRQIYHVKLLHEWQ